MFNTCLLSVEEFYVIKQPAQISMLLLIIPFQRHIHFPVHLSGVVFHLVKLLCNNVNEAVVNIKLRFCGLVLCPNDGLDQWFLKWGKVIIFFRAFIVIRGTG